MRICLLLLSSLLLTSCLSRNERIKSIEAPNTLKVVVTAKHQGWCYIVPVKEDAGIEFFRAPGDMYGNRENGIIYVPAGEMGSDILVYAGNKNITGLVKAMSHVKNARYDYWQFYIPGFNAQEPDSVKGSQMFDSLMLK